MTNEYRTPDEIERDIERDRAEMSGTLDALQEKFSVSAIASDIGSMFQGQGGQLGRSISQTVGRNPIAVTMVGVGLAWLVIGQSRSRASEASTWSPSVSPNRRNPVAGQTPRTDDQPFPGRRTDLFPAYDNDTAWYNSSGPGANRHQRRETDTDRPQDEADGIRATLRHGADAVTASVSQAAGSVRATAMDLTERLLSGTEGFSDEAKERILSARRMAHEARVASQDAMQRSSRAAQNMFEDQPLMVGALAVAIGAAIGGALPHSHVEDEAMGAERDRLFADAQRLFHEERTKAMAALKTVASEAGTVVRDAGSELADLLPDPKAADTVEANDAPDVAPTADSAGDGAYR